MIPFKGGGRISFPYHRYGQAAFAGLQQTAGSMRLNPWFAFLKKPKKTSTQFNVILFHCRVIIVLRVQLTKVTELDIVPFFPSNTILKTFIIKVQLQQPTCNNVSREHLDNTVSQWLSKDFTPGWWKEQSRLFVFYDYKLAGLLHYFCSCRSALHKESSRLSS